ncbi:MAG: methyltransferase domain-containing protein [Clostridiales bacterium]|nr:methyltransferase domain-containing protein [Clostridiales bacterium]
MAWTTLEEYYNKFNEDKRLSSRHGQVEYRTSMHYIHIYLERMAQRIGPGLVRDNTNISILDVGAGTGRYAVPLSEEGYSVTAIEPVKNNLGRLKQKGSNVTAYQGDARKLKRCADKSFDVVLLFGPMYHLLEEEDQLTALSEAKRVLKDDGYIFVSYLMNEYSVIMYAFKERHIMESLANGMLNEDYHCTKAANPLYHMMRVEDIERLNEQAGLKRVQIVAADGAADYMRPALNALSEEEFEEFVRYHMATCERPELLGASSHTLDILHK